MKRLYSKMSVIATIIFVILLAGAAIYVASRMTKPREPYGVFISIDNSEMSKLDNYDTVVIDAQYFTAADIEKLHNEGHTVYSYINIGSVENFRDYYGDFENVFLGAYENWNDEQWVDTSSSKWQRFVTEQLAEEISKKGVDGFWVDNCDVYYVYHTDSVYKGLEEILEGLNKYNKKIIINGGDAFLDKHYEENKRVDDIITGINQESVFTTINFDKKFLEKQVSSETEYFTSYITKYASEGTEIYLLEYTTDKSLVKKIRNYCGETGYKYYISDSIELD